MAWSPCPFKRFPGARQPDHQLPSWSHRSQAAIAPRATRVSCTPATTRETRHVRRTHHLYLGLGGRKLADISLSFYLSLSKRSLSFSFFSSSSSSRPLLLLLLLSPLSLSLALALARALSLSLSRSFALALARSLLIYLAYRARCFRSIFSTLLLISTRQTHLALSLSLSFFLSSTDVSRNFSSAFESFPFILSASSFSFFYFSTVFFLFFLFFFIFFFLIFFF